MNPLATHILVKFYGCAPELLNDIAKLEDIFLAAVSESGATYLEHHILPRKPHGVTGVVFVSEGYLAFLTCPEDGFISIGYFVCGATAMLRDAITFLTGVFRPQGVEQTTHQREHA